MQNKTRSPLVPTLRSVLCPIALLVSSFLARADQPPKIDPCTEAGVCEAPAVLSPWPLPSLSWFVQKLPAPPKLRSFRDRLDFQDVVARQATLTPAQLQHVQMSYRFSVFNFSEVLGPGFTEAKYPKTAAFFAKVATEANVVISALKNHYQRLRPFQQHPDQVHLYVTNEPGFGYPSGHTARARLFAYILANLSPPNRRALLNSGEQVGIDRILAGEHYQTDLEAGRKLAKYIYYSLVQDPAYQRDLLALRLAEWSNQPPPK